jgi:hypothetical protein
MWLSSSPNGKQSTLLEVDRLSEEEVQMEEGYDIETKALRLSCCHDVFISCHPERVLAY